MNTVEVNPDQLSAEVDSIMHGQAGSGPQAGPMSEQEMHAQQVMSEMQQAEQIATSYMPGCVVAVNAVARIMLPNWDLTGNEKQQIAESCSMALALWFPNLHIPPRYMALMSVGGVIWQIAASRRDAAGNLRPMRAQKVEPAASDEAQAA